MGNEGEKGDGALLSGRMLFGLDVTGELSTRCAKKETKRDVGDKMPQLLEKKSIKKLSWPNGSGLMMLRRLFYMSVRCIFAIISRLLGT